MSHQGLDLTESQPAEILEDRHLSGNLQDDIAIAFAQKPGALFGLKNVHQWPVSMGGEEVPRGRVADDLCERG